MGSDPEDSGEDGGPLGCLTSITGTAVMLALALMMLFIMESWANSVTGR